MSASTPCPEDHPLMIAWKAHQATEDFANSKKWAAYPEHLQGSLWGLFMAGFLAGAAPPRASPPETAGVPDRPKVYVYRRFPGATYTSLVDPRPFPNEDVAPIEWFAIYLPPTQASDETKAAP